MRCKLVCFHIRGVACPRAADQTQIFHSLTTHYQTQFYNCSSCESLHCYNSSPIVLPVSFSNVHRQCQSCIIIIIPYRQYIEVDRPFLKSFPGHIVIILMLNHLQRLSLVTYHKPARLILNIFYIVLKDITLSITVTGK